MWMGNLHKDKSKLGSEHGERCQPHRSLYSRLPPPPGLGRRQDRGRHKALYVNPIQDLQSSDGGKNFGCQWEALSKDVSHQTLIVYLKGLFNPPQVVPQVFGNLKAAQTLLCYHLHHVHDSTLFSFLITHS